MSEIKVNSIKGVGASTAAITVNNTDGTCTANITNNLSNRNIMINGNMVCHQRGGTITFANSAYSLDRWLMRTGGHSGAANITQSTTSPDGFQKSLKVDITTADTSLTGGEYFFIDQRIEANNVHHAGYGNSNAKTMTLSFYVRSNKTGTYNVHLYNTSTTKHLSRSYTINSADTWERKTLTIPPDTSGGLATGTGAALRCNWYLAAGTSYTSGSVQTTWSTYNVNNTAPSNVNLLDSTSNEWYLTGVQLEIGSVATDFEHRSFAQELQLCKRYYQQIDQASSSTSIMTGFGNGNARIRGVVHLPVEMRANPTVALDVSAGSPSFYSYTASPPTYSSLSGVESTTENIVVDINSSTVTAGAPYDWRGSGAFITISAEL